MPSTAAKRTSSSDWARSRRCPSRMASPISSCPTASSTCPRTSHEFTAKPSGCSNPVAALPSPTSSLEPIPAALKADLAAYTGCVAGAASPTELEAMLTAAGFTAVRVDSMFLNARRKFLIFIFLILVFISFAAYSRWGVGGVQLGGQHCRARGGAVERTGGLDHRNLRRIKNDVCEF